VKFDSYNYNLMTEEVAAPKRDVKKIRLDREMKKLDERGLSY